MTDPDEHESPRDRIETLLADLADELEGTAIRSDGDAREYSRSGDLFAVLELDALEVRVGPDIAGPALRTSDTTASERGPAWVCFAPRRIDRFGSDRATSWFEVAWRRAGGRPAG